MSCPSTDNIIKILMILPAIHLGKLLAGRLHPYVRFLSAPFPFPPFLRSFLLLLMTFLCSG